MRNFLNGRIDNLTRMAAYKDGDQIKMPLRIHLIDPLGRVRNVAVALWTGPPGNPRPATGEREPQPLPGDSAKQMFSLTYNNRIGMAEGEIVLPKLTDPKQFYWVSPAVTHSSGKTDWVSALGWQMPMVVERQPVQLKYHPAAKPMFVELSSRAALRMRDDEGDEGTIRSNFSVVMREQPTGGTTDGRGQLFRMKFSRVSANIAINDKPLTGKGNMTPMLRDLVQNVTLDVEMDEEGNLTRPQINFGQAPRNSREFITSIVDQVVPSLMVLTVPLSGETLPPLKSWKTQRLLDVGPMSISLPAQADLKYTYFGQGFQGPSYYNKPSWRLGRSFHEGDTDVAEGISEFRKGTAHLRNGTGRPGESFSAPASRRAF